MKKLIAAAAIAGSLFVSAVSSEAIAAKSMSALDAVKVLERWDNDTWKTDDLMDLGYINGVIHQTHNILNWEKMACIPDGVVIKNLTHVVRSWAEDNPEELHWPWASIAPHAIKEAYPCD